MKEKKRPTQSKPNSLQVHKKIQNDSSRKWDYIIPKEGSIKFERPPENNLSVRMSLIWPIATVDSNGKFSQEGRMDSLTTYHIPELKYNEVLFLLRDFGIPEHLYDDLIWFYLNMVFAACEASSETKFNEETRKEHKEWFEAFGMLEDLASGKLSLEAFSLEFRELTEEADDDIQSGLDKIKSKRFNSKKVIDHLIKIIHNYQIVESYEMEKFTYEAILETAKGGNSSKGFKNTTKAWQSYLSVVLFKYLTHQISNAEVKSIDPHFQHSGRDNNEWSSWSKRKIYLFIGKLMIRSGLIELKDTSLDDNTITENIIDTIEKKIVPEIKSKEALDRYKNPLLNFGIKGITVPPFYEHFVL